MMMMNKNSSEGIKCSWCDEDAVPGTEPPACAEHAGMRKKAYQDDGHDTLKELASDE